MRDGSWTGAILGRLNLVVRTSQMVKLVLSFSTRRRLLWCSWRHDVHSLSQLRWRARCELPNLWHRHTASHGLLVITKGMLPWLHADEPFAIDRLVISSRKFCSTVSRYTTEKEWKRGVVSRAWFTSRKPSILRKNKDNSFLNTCLKWR